MLLGGGRLMPPLVKAAALLMVLALALYSTGVWATFLAKRLRLWHLCFFWGGFLADSAGTHLMRRLAGGFHWAPHSVTGAAALLLMLMHALWASMLLLRPDAARVRNFHRLSVTVWAVWLIPFVSGLWLGYQAHR